MRLSYHRIRIGSIGWLVAIAIGMPMVARATEPDQGLHGRSHVGAEADWPHDQDPLSADARRVNQVEDGRAAQDLPAFNESIERRSRNSPVIRRAASSSADASGRPVDSDAATPWFRSALGSLLIVVALMVGLYYLARRFLPAARSVDSQALQVVARATISPKQSLALLHVGRRYVLVGVSAERLDVLTEVTDPQEVADLAIQVAGTGGRRGGGFESLLGREQSVYGARDTVVDEEEDSAVDGTGQRSAPVDDLLARLRSLKSA